MAHSEFFDPEDVSCERLDKAGWFERILQKLRNGTKVQISPATSYGFPFCESSLSEV